jgi:hypothetical protein
VHSSAESPIYERPAGKLFESWRGPLSGYFTPISESPPCVREVKTEDRRHRGNRQQKNTKSARLPSRPRRRKLDTPNREKRRETDTGPPARNGQRMRYSGGADLGPRKSGGVWHNWRNIVTSMGSASSRNKWMMVVEAADTAAAAAAAKAAAGEPKTRRVTSRRTREDAAELEGKRRRAAWKLWR